MGAQAQRKPTRPRRWLGATWLLAVAGLPAAFGQIEIEVPLGLFESVDIGQPTEAGTTLTNDGGSFTLIGGGADIWDKFDQCHFAFQVVEGDFDVRVRVAFLEPVHRWTKAGLMARESLAPDARMVFQRVTPIGPTQSTDTAGFGQNDSRFAFRTGLNDGFGVNGGQHEEGVGPAGFPSAWLRLRRLGSVLIGYSSLDGLHWTEQGRVDTRAWGNELGPRLFVGLAVTSHDDRPGRRARAEFRDLSATPKLPVTLVRQPRDVTVTEGQLAVLRVEATGYDPLRYLWFRDGTPLTAVGGPELSILATKQDDGAKFSVLVQNEVTPDGVSSEVATLRVLPDETLPLVKGVSADDTFTHVRLTFTEDVEPGSALAAANYKLDNGAVVRSAALLDDRFPNVVQLTTTPLTPDTTFRLTINGVRDLAGNAIAPDTAVSFRSWTLVRGFLRREIFTDFDGVLVADLLQHPGFPQFPDGLSFVDSFETPANIGDRYGVRLSGFVLPPITGDYRFYIASDDQGQLFWSSDADPANRKLICYEPQWNGPREWLTEGSSNPGGRNSRAPENVSAPLPLQAGQRYFVEALMKEGFGADHLAVTWQLPGQAPPKNGDPPLTGQVLGTFVDPLFLEDFRITGQPRGGTFRIGEEATLNVTVASLKPVAYRWRHNGRPVPDETGPTLRLPNAQPQDGGRYEVVVFSADRYARSQEALLVPDLPLLPLADNFADRTATSADNFAGRGSNRGFTFEKGEPAHVRKPGGRSAWLAWRPQASGIATWSTAGSSFDTLLAVYVGRSLEELQVVAANDDNGGGPASEVSFNARAGEEYVIAVDGLNGAAGDLVLSWSLEPTTELLPEIRSVSPSQALVSGAGLSLSVDSVATTVGAELLYQWLRNDVPLANGTAPVFNLPEIQPRDVGIYRVRIISRLGVDRVLLSPRIEVQINTAGETNVAAEDKLPDALARAGLLPEPGEPAAQPARLQARAAPANAPARGFSGTQIFSPYGATKEAGEPDHCGEAGGASEWFVYQPPADGQVTIDTTGSTFDTVLAVYTGPGTDFASLIEVACDNSSNGNGGDRVTFVGSADTVYFIAVDAVGGAEAIGPDDYVSLNYHLAAPPVLAPIGNKTVNEETLLTFTVSAADPNVPAETLTFSLVDAPAGASLDPTTGVFTWTPTEAQGPGEYVLTLRVTDSGSPALSDEETITITVNEVNTAPVLAPVGNRTIDEGALLSFTITATDADLPAQTLTFSLVDAPAGASLDPTTGVFTWTPTEAQGPGEYVLTLRVTDSGNPALSDEETITITVNEVNTAPVLADIPDRTVHATMTVGLTASASDPDLPANNLVFSLVSAPAGAAIDAATGAFTWTPAEADAGRTEAITVRVQDNGTPPLGHETTFHLRVEPRPTVQRIAADGGGLTLTWTAIPGLVYRVQHRPDLSGAGWNDLPGDITADGPTATKSGISLDGGGAGFYRVQVVP